MQTPDSIERTPRHDGWTDERKARFLDSLATKGNVRLACRKVNLSPEAAYRLKRRDPAFARAWAAALVRAHDCGLAALADRALDGVEEAVWFRGEQVGTRTRYDGRLLLAHLARLDKALEDEAAVADAARFDELVACVTGDGVVPGDLMGDDPLLPMGREEAAQRLAERADQAAEHAGGSEEDCVAAFHAGLARGAERWDGWREDACDYVDWLTGWNQDPPQPGLPGNPLPEQVPEQVPEPLRAALAAAAARPCESPAKSFSWTLSSPSTSALARGLAGAARAGAATPRSPRESRRASLR